jgi:hypothetical protein
LLTASAVIRRWWRYPWTLHIGWRRGSVVVVQRSAGLGYRHTMSGTWMWVRVWIRSLAPGIGVVHVLHNDIFSVLLAI